MDLGSAKGSYSFPGEEGYARIPALVTPAMAIRLSAVAAVGKPFGPPGGSRGSPGPVLEFARALSHGHGKGAKTSGWQAALGMMADHWVGRKMPVGPMPLRVVAPSQRKSFRGHRCGLRRAGRASSFRERLGFRSACQASASPACHVGRGVVVLCMHSRCK
jgi:hypothetical protein